MNIFIGRLASQTTEKELYLLFKQYGYISNIMLVRDKIIKKSRGYAYVVIKDEDDANRAIAALNNYELNGKKMMVKKARPREVRLIKDNSEN